MILTQNEIKKTAEKLHDNAIEQFKPDIFLGILDGCIPFLSDLMMFDNNYKIGVKTLKVDSYNGTTRGETIKLNLNFDLNDLTGNNVLIVDDIFDSGNTMKFITKKLEKYAKSIKWGCLLKRENCEEDDRLIPGSLEIKKDQFVVGYGLDYNGMYRTFTN